MSSNDNVNILKIRDDNEPTLFNLTGDKFVAESENICWANPEGFTKNELRARIEPWLTSLFQSEHLSLLAGSGLSSAIQHIAGASADNGMDPKNLDISYFKKEIEQKAEETAKETGRNNVNIEDTIRTMYQLIDGLKILQNSLDYKGLSEKLSSLKKDLEKIFLDFTTNISMIENSILTAKADRKIKAFNTLALFLMSFASRTGTRDRLNIFTTNYDRVIEAGADIAGMRLIDRFVGTLCPIFRSSRLDVDMHYNPPGIRNEPRFLEGVARFTKLHGSLDWIKYEGEIRRFGLPFGATSLTPFLEAFDLKDDKYSSIMVYPNAAKDKETTEYPYMELFRDFASALCRTNSTLVTYGYSFGDDHINRIIRDMLTIPSTHLVVISFDDSTGRIIDKYSSWGHQDQMSLIIGKDIADLEQLVNYYLPKPSVDFSTLRMAEIIRQRFIQNPEEKEERSQNVDTNS